MVNAILILNIVILCVIRREPRKLDNIIYVIFLVYCYILNIIIMSMVQSILNKSNLLK